MALLLHRFAALTAMFCIATFFSATILVELFGSVESVAKLKSLIVWPGLLILVPAMALTGRSGFALSKSREGGLVQQKRRRMVFIAINGLLVLIPCAVLLDRWAASGAFGTEFYIVQGIELLAGAVNLILMGMNMKSGLKMRKNYRTPASLT
jgi:hypothetical protein